jgi:hypothetical protein
MKKLFIFSFVMVALFLGSCNGNSDTTHKNNDTVSFQGTASPDSAANNGIIPPSAAPGNAGNSSLADTGYHAKDSSLKSKK